MSTTPLAELNRMDRSAFVSSIGWVYEHSPWVADKAWEHRPFADLDALHSAMDAVVQAAPEEKRLTLIRAHPDLAGRQAKLGQLTEASNHEQTQAGLKGLTPNSRLNWISEILPIVRSSDFPSSFVLA